jgi:hypothetical protein
MRLLLTLSLIIGSLSARKSIVIDLTKQEVYAYENGRLVMSGWVSTGKYGHRTPRGRFRILEKDLKHVSSKYPKPYGGARMDYMMRLTGSGIAMHLGFVPNYPASHGCIRLPNGVAQKFYSWAPVGTPVLIKGNTPVRITRRGSRSGLFSPSPRSSYSRTSSSVANDIADAGCIIDDPINMLSSVPGKAKCANYKPKPSRVTKKSTKRGGKRLIAKESRVRRVRKIKRIKPNRKSSSDPLSILKG